MQVSFCPGGNNSNGVNAAFDSLQRLEGLKRQEIILTFEFENNNLYGSYAVDTLKLSESEVEKKAKEISSLNDELANQRAWLMFNKQFSHEIKCCHSQELLDELKKNIKDFRELSHFIEELDKVQSKIANKGVLPVFAGKIAALRACAQKYQFADEREEELRKLFDR